MSKQAMKAILGRCVMDEDYRALLFADPDQALTSYELTGAERAALMAVDGRIGRTRRGTSDLRGAPGEGGRDAIG